MLIGESPPGDSKADGEQNFCLMKPICNQSLLDGCHVLWYTDITNQKGNFRYAKVTVMLMFDTQKFGRAIATLRKEADMTQNEVADRLNLSRQAVSRYECGVSQT